MSITNSPSPSRVTNPGFESDHVVVHFAKSTITGTLDHFRDINSDNFVVDVQASNDKDAERRCYYRFKDRFHALLDEAYH